MEKVLLASNVASMMQQFNMKNIELLQRAGYEVHIACNFLVGNNITEDVISDFLKMCEVQGIKCHQLNILRTLFTPKIKQVYNEIRDIVKNNDFKMIHVHSPIAGVLTRIAARKKRRMGTKIIYTAHGFHFFKGAPCLNWLVYYPVEWICSWITDCIITINREDFNRAKRHMHARKIEYIPGVGVDIQRFRNTEVDRVEKRKEIGVPDNAVLLLSVGELNKNKNHETIIRAMSELKDEKIHYAIAGIGPNKEELLRLAKELKVEDNFHLLGYRTDICEINKISDIFCFPSYREGLGLSAIEAMASGKPIITSNVHGICDYSKNGVTGFSIAPTDVEGFKEAIVVLIEDHALREKMGENNSAVVDKFSWENVNEEMRRIYEGVLKDEYKGKYSYTGI